MGDQTAHETEEADHVREFAVGLEGGFVLPFRMNVKREGRADGFEQMDADVARFGARRLEEQEQLVAELLLFSGCGFEPDEGVKRHVTSPHL